jgi:hypothetical protein
LAIFRFEALNLDFNEWVIKITLIALPVAVFCSALKAIFVALGLMSRI